MSDQWSGGWDPARDHTASLAGDAGLSPLAFDERGLDAPLEGGPRFASVLTGVAAAFPAAAVLVWSAAEFPEAGYGPTMLGVLYAVVAAAVLGARYRRAAAAGGMILTFLVASVALAGLAFPPYFGCIGFGDGAMYQLILVLAIVLVVPGYGVGRVIGWARGRGGQQRDADAGTVRRARAVGLVCAILAAAVVVPAAGVSASDSFELPLPAGWTVSDEHFSPLTGIDLTATRSSHTYASSLPDVDTIGVSVFRPGKDQPISAPSDCVRGAETFWTFVPFLPADAVRTGREVSLPAGAAWEETATLTSGAHVYGFGLLRERRLGLVSQPLCYTVFVTLVEGSPLTPGDVEAIVATFRYR